MVELERELTFLINELPSDLDKFPSKIVEDNYLPKEVEHPVIRIRRNGNKMFITKKYPVDSINEMTGDSSHMVEHTISLTQPEYEALNSYDGKKSKKRRFAYEVNGYAAELDVYLGALSGLVTIDFEFDDDKAMKDFKKPDFVGADVTYEHDLAGGMLCGKAYSDIAEILADKYDYKSVDGVEKYEESL